MVNIIGVQLLLIFFGLFMLYVSFLYWTRRLFTKITFISWLVIWIGFLFFSIFPNVLKPLLVELFFVRAMDFGMIVAFMILTFLTIENNVRIKSHEDKLEKLVRELAIKKLTREKK